MSDHCILAESLKWTVKVQMKSCYEPKEPVQLSLVFQPNEDVEDYEYVILGPVLVGADTKDQVGSSEPDWLRATEVGEDFVFEAEVELGSHETEGVFLYLLGVRNVNENLPFRLSRRYIPRELEPVKELGIQSGILSEPDETIVENAVSPMQPTFRKEFSLLSNDAPPCSGVWSIAIRVWSRSTISDVWELANYRKRIVQSINTDDRVGIVFGLDNIRFHEDYVNVGFEPESRAEIEDALKQANYVGPDWNEKEAKELADDVMCGGKLVYPLDCIEAIYEEDCRFDMDGFHTQPEGVWQ